MCGNCNHNLIKRKYKNNIKYLCTFNKNTSNDSCFDGFIQRTDIEDILLDRIKKEIKLFIDLKNQNEKIKLKIIKEKENLLKEKNV